MTDQVSLSIARLSGWLDRNPNGGAEPIHPDDLRTILSTLSPSPSLSGDGEAVNQKPGVNQMKQEGEQ